MPQYTVTNGCHMNRSNTINEWHLKKLYGEVMPVCRQGSQLSPPLGSGLGIEEPAHLHLSCFVTSQAFLCELSDV